MYKLIAMIELNCTGRGGQMYKRILLAYDGSVEGRTALREGALLARRCGAEVFLLSVLVDPGTFVLTEVALAGASVQMEDDFIEVLNEGVARLRALGFDPVAKLVRVAGRADQAAPLARRAGLPGPPAPEMEP